MKPVFLDHHSTTPLDPKVLKAMMPYFTTKYGNPSSQHDMGAQALEAVENARDQVAKIIGANSNQIYFTNSATEANNVVLQCAGDSLVYLSTNYEHPSVSKTLDYLKQSHRVSQIVKFKANKDGTLDLEKLLKSFRAYCPSLVSVMAANNEIGVINPVAEIGKICKENDVLFHTDATQAVGKTPIDIKDIDFLTFSSHKIYGAKGAGALYCKNPKLLQPLIYGGLQNTFTSGTINVPAVVGFGKACELMVENADEGKRIGALRDALLDRLLSEIKGSYVNGTMENRLYNNISLTIPGVSGRDLVGALSGEVCISTGSACHSLKFKPSDTIKALKIEHPDCVIRISLGRFNTAKEIKIAGTKIIEMAKILRKNK